VQWSPTTDDVEVVNYSAGPRPGLVARAEVLDPDGTVRWQGSAPVDSVEDSVLAPLRLEFPAPLAPVHFVRLKLTRGDAPLSENFYWRGAAEGDFRALRDLKKVKLEVATRAERRGDRVLPALWSDGYVSLMPGEGRTITVEVEARDARGEEPRIVVEGFNVQP
jgi:hypothetical protein